MSQFKIGEFFLLFSALTVALLAYVVTSGKIADHDAFVMGEVAQRLVDGKTLYVEAWDNKPPLALLFYYPSQAIAPHSYLGQQIFTFLWTAAQALIIFFLLSGEKLWIRVVIAVVVLWMPLTRTDFAWGSSEDAVNGFTLLLAVSGYRVLRDGRIDAWLWLICGMAAGFALHARQTGFIFIMLSKRIIPFRPPGGIINLPVLLACILQWRKIYLWSKDPKDFKANSTAEILQYFEHHPLKSGDIVLLHGSTIFTAESLDRLLIDMAGSGLHAAVISEA